MLLIDEKHVGKVIAAVDTRDEYTYQAFLYDPAEKTVDLLIEDHGSACYWSEVDSLEQATKIGTDYITQQRARHAEEMGED